MTVPYLLKIKTDAKNNDSSKRSIYILEIGKGRLTVGKIYGGLLILENWKATKFGKGGPGDPQVKFTIIYIFLKFGVIFRPKFKILDLENHLKLIRNYYCTFCKTTNKFTSLNDMKYDSLLHLKLRRI